MVLYTVNNNNITGEKLLKNKHLLQSTRQQSTKLSFFHKFTQKKRYQRKVFKTYASCTKNISGHVVS